ncbi:MAG: hypothetical protein K2R98_33650 [Gemmataceae bacterium]|nr:hypothetical protein [Gemmataceae bacterium]
MKRLALLLVALLVIATSSCKSERTLKFSDQSVKPRPEKPFVMLTAADFSADGRFLLLGHQLTNSDLRPLPRDLQLFVLWDLIKGERVKSWGGYDGAVRFLKLLPDGKRALCMLDSRGLTLIDMASGKEIWAVNPNTHGTSWNIGLSPDGTLALTQGSDDTSYARILKVWNVQTGMLVRTLGKSGGSGSTLMISPDNKSALSGCQGQSRADILVWRLSDGEVVRWFKGSDGWSIAGPFLPDSKSAFLMKGGAKPDDDQNLLLVNLLTGEVLRTFNGSVVNPLGLTPDGKRLTTRTGQATVTVWDPNNGDLLRTLELPRNDQGIDPMIVSRDGKRLFTSVRLPNAPYLRNELWDVQEGTMLRTFGYE